MKRTLILAALMVSAVAATSMGKNQQGFESLDQFTSSHPRYSTNDALGATANLRASAGDSQVKVQLCVRDASLQQRFLRTGLTLCVDPSASKKTIYAILFPPLPPAPPQEGEEPQRKRAGFGVENMVKEMREQTVLFVAGSDTIAMPSESVEMKVDDNGALTFTALVPYELLGLGGTVPKKWQFGILSSKPEEMNFPQPGEGRPQPPSGGNKDFRPEGGMPPGEGMGGRGGMGGMGGMGGRPAGGPPSGGGRRGGGGMMPSGSPSGSFSGSTQSKASKYINSDIKEWVKVSHSDMSTK